MNLLTYNVKLIFWQKLELVIFPALTGALTAAVWYSSADKVTGSKMLIEFISPFVLGLLVTDIPSREAKWKTTEIIYTKVVSPRKIFFLRYFLILMYGILILSTITVLFWSFADFFEMRSFFVSIPVILLVTSLGMLLSIVLGQNIAAFGIIFLFLIEGSAGPRYLPLFLFLETFSPSYEHLWLNRGALMAISLGLYVLSYRLLKSPERVVR